MNECITVECVSVWVFKCSLSAANRSFYRGANANEGHKRKVD